MSKGATIRFQTAPFRQLPSGATEAVEAETASSLEACGKIRRFYFEAKRQGSTPAISGFKDTTPDYA